MSPRTALLALFAALALIVGIPLRAQQEPSPILRAVNASGGTLATAAARTDSMLRDGTLDLGEVQSDTMIDGRTHERLDQRYQNLPVFGGQLVRQLDGSTPVSVFGRVFDNVSLPTVDPAIDAATAAAKAEEAAGDGAEASPPVLGVLATADQYVLVYRTRVTSRWDIRIYYVN